MTEQSESTDGQRASSDILGSSRKENKDTDASPMKAPKPRPKRKRLSAWQRSVAGQAARAEFTLTLLLSTGLLIAGYIVFILAFTSSGSLPKGEIAIAIGLSVVGFVGVLVAFFRNTLARIRFQEATEAKSRQAVDSAIDKLEDDPSFSALLKVNQTQMDQYHDITKHQAAHSYRNSQLAMGSGLAIIVLAAIAAIVLKDDSAKIILGSIAGVATAFSAYIGATFLNAYRSALKQLNTYFNQPLVASYLLSAERIAGTMSREHRDEMRAKIIGTMLQGAIDDRGLQSEAASSQPPAFRRNKSVKGAAPDGSTHVSGTV
jgi:hypothetical protein